MENYDLYLIILLSWPLCWAGYLILAKNEAGIAKVNSVGDWLVGKQSQYANNSSFFSKYIFASFLSPFKKLMNMTGKVEDVFKQGGLRALVFGYYGIVLCYLISAVVFGVAVFFIAGVVIFISILAAIFIWNVMTEGVGYAFSNLISTFIRSNDSRETVMPSESREKSNWVGDKWVEHTDENGNVIGKSESKSNWVGDNWTEHTDESGNVVGESKNKSNWVGDKWVEHTKKK